MPKSSASKAKDFSRTKKYTAWLSEACRRYMKPGQGVEVPKSDDDADNAAWAAAAMALVKKAPELQIVRMGESLMLVKRTQIEHGVTDTLKKSMEGIGALPKTGENLVDE